MIELRVLELDHMEKIVEERNKVRETLRTPYLLNYDMQLKWFEKVICNRDSSTRYFSIDVQLGHKEECPNYRAIGYGGIENIQWENRSGEISILIFEEFRKKGYGKEAVDKILVEGFGNLNLNTIWGECYYCSSAVDFWKKQVESYRLIKPAMSTLPNRKFYMGQYWDSLYFSFSKE